MTNRNMLVVAAALMTVACTVRITEVVPAGKDTFVVSGNAVLKRSSGESIKPTLYEKANAHCKTMGKKLLPVNEFASLYAAELRFRCLEENDPAYARPIMESAPNVPIERK